MFDISDTYGMTHDAQRDAVVKFMEDYFHNKPVYYRTVLPELFSREFVPLQLRIIDAIQAPERFKLILAPRGLGKTTIGQATAIDAICSGQKRFIVYISKSATLAEMQTENIKRVLTSNEFIKACWGSTQERFFDLGDLSEEDMKLNKGVVSVVDL